MHIRKIAATRHLGILLLSTILLACQTTGAIKPDVSLSQRFDANVYSRFAIYVDDRSGARLDDGILRSVDDVFTRAAISKGYTIATRSDMSNIARELEIQESGFTETAMAKRARALNVPAILVVSINSVGVEKFTPLSSLLFEEKRNTKGYRSKINISARMISAEEAQIIWVASLSDSSYIGERADRTAARMAVPEIAVRVAQELPSRNGRMTEQTE